jgi:hypothetical protein
MTSPFSPAILARLLDRATLDDPLSHLLAVPPDRAAHLDGLWQLTRASESPYGTSRNLEQSRHLIGGYQQRFHIFNGCHVHTSSVFVTAFALRFNPGRPNGPVGQTPAAVWPALTPRNRYALAGFNATTAGFSSC